MKTDNMTEAEAIKNGLCIAAMISLLSLSFTVEDVMHSNLFASLSILSGLYTFRKLSI